ncbi:putative lipoprotein NlpE involved in copper resistance [Shewanella psychrophila]|uniref:Putative lipoprotein NlpE involved in copper resistance n=2 Tax=Shewanella psychrophila TaxID=225848 RepID=A0A1S6HWQ4_9GAMM|nr:putative lipoprotein NlpE involved in copper resistance [Shewanella psychrophila]
MKLQLIAVSLLALGISACSKQETPTQESAPASQVTEHVDAARDSAQQTKETLPLGDTSRTSLDWNGTYSGVTPCASCEGIDTTLTLKPDNTYVLETRYLGDETEAKKIFTEAGSFEWNREGNRISLMGNASRKENPQQFLVGENQLLMLDMKGNQITSSLAELYRLSKQG